MSNNPRSEPEDLACAGSRGELDIDSIKFQLKEKGWVVLRAVELDTLEGNYSNVQSAVNSAHHKMRQLERKNRRLIESQKKAAKLVANQKTAIAATNKELDACITSWESAYSLEANDLQGAAIDDLKRVKEILNPSVAKPDFVVSTDGKGNFVATEKSQEPV